MSYPARPYPVTSTTTDKPDDSGAKYRNLWSTPTSPTEKSHHDSPAVARLAQRIKRNTKADELNQAYYDFITDHYQWGWGDRFHFCGYAPGETWSQAQARSEHFIALMAGIQPGMKVLDVGCGVAAPAREIARFTECEVTGVTNCQLHVDRGNWLTEANGLAQQVRSVKGTFVDLPFEDGSFDAVYATEALCCSPDMDQAYQEVFRVLKPGRRLVFTDWVMTPEYDDEVAEHRKIREEIEFSSSVPLLTTAREHVAALERAGFEVVMEEDLAVARANPIPWWWALDGRAYQGMTLVDRWDCFLMTPLPFTILYSIWKLLDFLGFCDPWRMMALDTVAMCVYSLRDGGREGIFTPIHLFVARKPEKSGKAGSKKTE